MNKCEFCRFSTPTKDGWWECAGVVPSSCEKALLKMQELSQLIALTGEADKENSEKIKKAIEEIEELPQYEAKFKDCTEIHICREDVLEILRNIGE